MQLQLFRGPPTRCEFPPVRGVRRGGLTAGGPGPSAEGTAPSHAECSPRPVGNQQGVPPGVASPGFWDAWGSGSAQWAHAPGSSPGLGPGEHFGLGPSPSLGHLCQTLTEGLAPRRQASWSVSPPSLSYQLPLGRGDSTSRAPCTPSSSGPRPHPAHLELIWGWGLRLSLAGQVMAAHCGHSLPFLTQFLSFIISARCLLYPWGHPCCAGRQGGCSLL